MKTLLFLFTTLVLHVADVPITLVIHGGAGVTREDLSPEKEAACRQTLEAALLKGHQILRAGGTSLDAVQAAIILLEDSPLFNAGRGSALSSTGTVEMDASIMDGQKHAAGAAASVTGVRNPIRLARLIMERSPHVLLAGQGAEAFAKEHQLPFEPAEYFITPDQQERLRKAKKAQASAAPLTDLTLHMGTVGAVALDKNGHLAAGTSTGGTMNKRPGRIGDSPIIGAGTYAEDGVCAVSCTGHGESFIRTLVANDVAAYMKYAISDVTTSAHRIIHEVLPAHSGKGGIIALDAAGHITTPFNTPGMFHGWIKADGTVHVAIFEE